MVGAGHDGLPPALATASAISSASVATATGPIPASTARRHTWTIMGSPADIRQRLVRQAGGSQAGRDEDEGIGHGAFKGGRLERP